MVRFNKKPAKGKFLVSEPFLEDPNFKRSVILLSEHNDEGTVGFILNKPVDAMINDAITDFPPFDSNIYFGGPVQTDTLHYIHVIGEKLPESKKIMNGIYWGGDFDILKLMIEAGQVKPSDIRFYVGYSGWGSAQLAKEIKEQSWILAPGNKQFTFSGNYKSLWRDVLKSMGKEYSILSNFPEDPSLN